MRILIALFCIAITGCARSLISDELVTRAYSACKDGGGAEFVFDPSPLGGNYDIGVKCKDGSEHVIYYVGAEK